MGSTEVSEKDPTGETDEEESSSEEAEGEVATRGVEISDRGKHSGKPGRKPGKGKKPNRYNNPKDNALRKEFMLIDLDNSGFIDAKDLAKATGGFIPESFFAKAIKAVDTNRDGKVSFAEYKTVRSLAKTFKQAAFGGGNANATNNNNTQK